MTATISVRCHHTNGDDGGTDVAGGTLRFKLADNDAQDASNQVARGSASVPNLSWIKQLRLFATVTPLNSISNIKFYMTGAKPTGVDVLVKTSATYTAPVTNAATALAGVTSGFTYTPIAPLSVNGSLANPSTGQIGDFVQLQLSALSTANVGVVPSGTFWFRYDES